MPADSSSQRHDDHPRISRRSLLLGMAAGGVSAVLSACAAPSLNGISRRPILGGAARPSFKPAAANLRSSYVAPAPPPNIVLITVDTLRADQLGAYGHPFVKTPSLDALARSGAVFLSHLVQQPQTNASHASLFSGMYPASNGVRVQSVDKLPATLATLATTLSAAGYQTAGLFSWLSLEAQYSGLQRGFDSYTDLSAPLQPGADPFDLGTRKGTADRTTNAAIAQIQSFKTSAPYFLWVHYFDPHYPYQPPGSFAQLYDSRYAGPIDGSLSTIGAIESGQLKPTAADITRLQSLYQGEISFADSQLGRLFHALEGSAAGARTVITLTGDHGESFGEHAALSENGDFFHPHTLYNAEQRVPLLLHFPGFIRPGLAVSAPTQAIDLFPTLLELAGVKVPPQAQGASLLTLMDGSDAGSARAAYSSMPDDVFSSVASGGWKLIRNNVTGQVELYDLTRDPAEQQDRSDDGGEVRTSLNAMLDGWMKDVGIA